MNQLINTIEYCDLRVYQIYCDLRPSTTAYELCLLVALIRLAPEDPRMASNTGKGNGSKRKSFDASEEGGRFPFTKREFKHGVKVRQIVWVKETASIVTETIIKEPCHMNIPRADLDPDTTYIELPPGPALKKQKGQQ